jgi:hypothetical protein
MSIEATTWTCEDGNINPRDMPMCLKCGKARPVFTILNDEERDALAMKLRQTAESLLAAREQHNIEVAKLRANLARAEERHREEIEKMREKLHPSSTRENLNALCRYLNGPDMEKLRTEDMYPGMDIAKAALVLLKRLKADADKEGSK